MLSDELCCLEDADKLLADKQDVLYSEHPLYLSTDGVSSVARGVLIGARQYIKRQIQAHIRGTK